MKKCVASLVLGFALLSPISGFCSMVSPLAPTEAAVSFDVTVAETQYETPNDRFSISRAIESGTWSYGSFFATLGYVSKTEFEDFETADLGDDETGYVFAVGARGPVWTSGDFSTVLHAQFHSLNEQVILNDRSYDLQSLELLAGADEVWSPGPWSVYAGFQVVPYSDIDLDFVKDGEVERTDFISLRVGGRVPLGPVFLDVEVPFLGTEGVRIGLSYAF